MLQTLQSLDVGIFRFINGSMSNPLFDALLPWFREKWFWAPAYLFVIAFTFEHFGKKALPVLFGLVLTVSASDMISSQLVKKSIQRLRPCNDPEMSALVHLRAPCGSGYSFTSSHASNHFAVAVFLWCMFGRLGRWVKPVVFAWAALVALSQVYVGVHYPFDVMAGALLGMAIGRGGGSGVLRLMG
jgi:undecaprenyl-diphosphatase